ncbi:MULTISPECIES: hypothetical protein [unclassified Nostoc]|nr:hypothetical protein [Nostoc sp. DedQUE03]MDZ7975725.1 hypothetical protein [Nostoc sp. DedQUE03]MDZ8048428.1 hypothetical protein [Nostoc sp. DedQUE02]
MVRDLPPQRLRFPKGFSLHDGVWTMETELLNASVRTFRLGQFYIAR